MEFLVDQRSKMLTLAFAVVFGGGLVSSVIYPRWIKPLVTIKDAIARLEKQRDALVEDQRRVDNEVRAFRGFVNRVGALDIRRVENEIRARLNEMLAEHKLDSVSVTPNTPRTIKKIGTQEMTVTVKAEGSLESAIKLMRDIAELPHLVRVLNTTIQPVSGGRRKTRGKKKEERVTLTVPLQIMALPQQRLAGRIEKDDIEQPEVFVRHENRDYSSIWTRTPFTPYIVYPPLKVTIKEPNIKVQETKRCNLEAVATGGDGDYEFVWTPSGGIDKPTARRVRVDTRSTGKRSYTVTVTDGQGEVAKATANLEITAKPKPRHVAKNDPKPPPPPPPPTGPQRWKNGRDLQLCMALLNRSGSERHSEIMVHNNKSGETTYYTIGDEFDAGTLVYVHPTGALVRREVDKQDKYFVYPIGAALTEDLASEAAVDYPKLQASANWFAQRDQERQAAAANAAKSDAPGGGDASGAKNSAKPETPAGGSTQPDTQPPTSRKPPAADAQKPAKAAEAGAIPPVLPGADKEAAAARPDRTQPLPGKGVHSTGAAGVQTGSADKPGASGKPATRAAPVNGTPGPAGTPHKASVPPGRSAETGAPKATRTANPRSGRVIRSRRNRGTATRRYRPTGPKARKKD